MKYSHFSDNTLKALILRLKKDFSIAVLFYLLEVILWTILLAEIIVQSQSLINNAKQWCELFAPQVHISSTNTCSYKYKILCT